MTHNNRVPGNYPLRDPDPNPYRQFRSQDRLTALIGDGLVGISPIVTGGVKLVYVPPGSVTPAVLAPRV